MPGVLPRYVRKHSQRLLVASITLVAFAPLLHTVRHIAAATRNIVYWDEFDTALALLLQLDSDHSVVTALTKLVEVSNEHRMVTSRLIFVISYWLTGTINFAVLSAIGNSFVVLLCGLLVWNAETTVRRLRLALPLAFLLFQLEHYENLFWSGSSIDHFQVVLLVAAAIVALARDTRSGLMIGVGCALLATFTLAHGMLAWPVGAAMLWRSGRRKHLRIWCSAGAIAVGGFGIGFHFNRAEHFTSVSPAGAAHVVVYWLKLLGAVPALGSDTAAPWLGAAGLGMLGILARHGAIRREPVLFPLACFGVGASALIAIGRAEEVKSLVQSRYLVLGALVWALVIFMALSRWSHPRRPWVSLLVGLPFLACFNVAANDAFASKAAAFVECRDRAALRYKQHGRDGGGPFALNPQPEHATTLLTEAERRGVYHLPPICRELGFPRAEETNRITYFIDELIVDPRCAVVAGWAAIPDVECRRGALHVVLRSATETHVFTTVTIERPDVVAATNHPEWKLCGFRFGRLRSALPVGEFQLGLLITSEDGHANYIMSDHRVLLTGRGEARLAVR